MRPTGPGAATGLAAEQNALAPGGERREIATLFTDIAGFTPLVESLDPKQLAGLLSGYLEGMTEVVFAHEGTVAKIIGDAIHVLFGAPADQPDAASRAIDCALALDTHAERYRQEWMARGAPLGVTRIGVHAGPAIVGNFGGGRLFDYTAYGDTINTAARLEAVNKQLGTRICVSAAAAERATGFNGRPVGDLLLRGRSEPMRVFEPLLPEDRASHHTLAYASAFSKLEAHDPAALAAFAALVGECPADALAQYHLRRLLNGGAGTRIEMS
jgi:adenylate cyclase